jgi:hypothetical protein
MLMSHNLGRALSCLLLPLAHFLGKLAYIPSLISPWLSSLSASCPCHLQKVIISFSPGFGGCSSGLVHVLRWSMTPVILVLTHGDLAALAISRASLPLARTGSALASSDTHSCPSGLELLLIHPQTYLRLFQWLSCTH